MATYPTPALQRAYVSAPADEFIITTLELSHSRFYAPGVFYLNDSPSNITALLEDGRSIEFTAFPFQVKLPNSDGQGVQELGITISNAGQDYVKLLLAAAHKPEERVVAILRIYLSSDLTQPHALPLRLSIDNILMDDDVITATANKMDVLNFPFPSINFAPDMFPGLKR